MLLVPVIKDTASVLYTVCERILIVFKKKKQDLTFKLFQIKRLKSVSILCFPIAAIGFKPVSHLSLTCVFMAVRLVLCISSPVRQWKVDLYQTLFMSTMGGSGVLSLVWLVNKIAFQGRLNAPQTICVLTVKHWLFASKVFNSGCMS